MKLHFLSRSSRAAVVATRSQIILVLVQLSLAVTLCHKAQPAFERPSVPCTANRPLRRTREATAWL
jgi:hypothetical protein